MKFIHTILLLIFTSTFSLGQKAGVIFYDTDWKITTKEESAYYRTCIIDTAKLTFYGEAKDYFKNGQLQMMGNYYDNVKVDSFYFYYPNGAIESFGFYENNLRSGIWKYYYENKQLKQTVEFSETDFIIKEFFDSLGNSLIVNGAGVWFNSYKMQDILMWVSIKGELKDWKRDGKWEVYERSNYGKDFVYHHKYKNGTLKSQWYSGTFLSLYFPDKYKFASTEAFKYSVFVSRKNYPFIKKLPMVIDSLKLPYSENATFPGGNVAFSKFLNKHLIYPDLAKKERVEKRIIVEITIDENGGISNIEYVGMNIGEISDKYGFYNEITRVIRLFPKWNPAVRNDAYVPQKRFFMISFTMNEIIIKTP